MATRRMRRSGSQSAILRPPDLADDIAEDMARVRQGESVEGHETVRLTRDGRRVNVSLSITPMRRPSWVRSCRSPRFPAISPHARLQTRPCVMRWSAYQANVEAKDRFLAMMSHELRTPLQSVLGYADLLLRAPDAALNAEQREDLGAIHRGAARMVTLIDQKNLDLSRIKAGHLVLERASVRAWATSCGRCAVVYRRRTPRGLPCKSTGRRFRRSWATWDGCTRFC